MTDDQFTFKHDFTEDVQRRVGNVTASIAAEVARQTDMAICKQLVAMGWTPPPHIQQMMEADHE